MASTTVVTANFQARDWEFLVGITGPTNDVDMQDCLDKLRQYYADQATKPQGSTVINISTVEGVVISMFQTLLSVNTGVTQTDNLQPYTRVRAAVLDLNNTADNYILDTVTAIEAANQSTQGSIRKQGRRSIMMRTYDNA